MADGGGSDGVAVATEASSPPKPPEPPPKEPPVYHVMWSKLVLAAAIGFTYATVAPLSLLFVLAYLGIAYVLYARSLLFSQRAACTKGPERAVLAARLTCGG